MFWKGEITMENNNTERKETSRTYSKEIAAVIRKVFEDDELKFDFEEDEKAAIFDVSFTLDGKPKDMDMRFIVLEDAFAVFAESDAICADPDNADEMRKIAEFITRINDARSSFTSTLSYEDGRIRGSIFTDCEDSLPSEEIVRNCIRRSFGWIEDFGPGFLKVLYGGVSPKEAFDACVENEEDDEEDDEEE